MATYTPKLLSGSTNGRPIAVAATASPGTTIHTAVAGTSSIDMISLVASNISASDVDLTLEWGNTATSDDLKMTIPAKSVVPLPTLPLQNGLLLKAFAGTASVINIDGSITQIV